MTLIFREAVPSKPARVVYLAEVAPTRVRDDNDDELQGRSQLGEFEGPGDGASRRTSRENPLLEDEPSRRSYALDVADPDDLVDDVLVVGPWDEVLPDALHEIRVQRVGGAVLEVRVDGPLGLDAGDEQRSVHLLQKSSGPGDGPSGPDAG